MGQFIKKEMDKRKWTNYRLSRESGVTPTQIQSMIYGKTNYTIDSFMAVFNAFKINFLTIND